MTRPAGPLRIAHRGLPALAPENTLAGFRLAAEAGAQALELDVRATRDQRLVVLHDPTLDRTTDGGGLLGAINWAELQRLDAGDGQRVPSLEQALAAAPGLRPMLDVKILGREDALLEHLRASGSEESALISSFDPRVLAALRQRGTSARLALSYPEDRYGASVHPLTRRLVPAALSVMRTRLPSTLARACVRHQVDLVSLYHPLVGPRLVEQMARRGIGLVAWTVNDVGRALQLAEWGVEGVVTDDPAVLAALAEGAASGP